MWFILMVKLESSRTWVSSRYKAKYVNGMKMFMAFISSTANKMNITIAKNNALNGVVAELTW